MSFFKVPNHSRAECGVYRAAKGALNALSRCVAVHCREQGNGIRCNTIVAGSIPTPMIMRALSEMPEDSPSFDELEGHGLGQPSDVAQMVLDLASDAPGMSTGRRW
ncbi:MAG: SDR family oxidoreductase [Novosphingobium sp.]